MAAMQAVVASTKAMSDRFAVGDAVFDACKQYWKDTSATTNKDLACSQLRKSVQSSAGGNVGKRAGLLCSLMSECDTAAALVGATLCNITASNSTASRLDLCSVEGVSNATAVPGILATAGEWKGRYGCWLMAPEQFYQGYHSAASC